MDGLCHHFLLGRVRTYRIKLQIGLRSAIRFPERDSREASRVIGADGVPALVLEVQHDDAGHCPRRCIEIVLGSLLDGIVEAPAHGYENDDARVVGRAEAFVGRLRGIAAGADGDGMVSEPFDRGKGV